MREEGCAGPYGPNWSNRWSSIHSAQAFSTRVRLSEEENKGEEGGGYG